MAGRYGRYTPHDEPSLQGFSRHFNGKTIKGRANVVKATYASVGLLIAYFALRPKPTPEKVKK